MDEFEDEKVMKREIADDNENDRELNIGHLSSRGNEGGNIIKEQWRWMVRGRWTEDKGRQWRWMTEEKND